jgi:2-polyprenyl-6-methoxyphenol hydroxylase-like FAD-dependent oxidoreductase
MYDAIVVGARCAGATTAMLLARAGHRVLLMDRARFPRDSLSTLYINTRGVSRLMRWGLLDRIVAAGTPALDRVSYRIGAPGAGAVTLDGPPGPTGDATAAYAPRRFVLDDILVRAAVAAGAELWEGCSVTGLEFADGRVVGVRTKAGVTMARLVIGADGMRSTVADAVQAPTIVEDSPKTCVYYSFFADTTDHFELYEAPSQWIGAVPTNDGATLVQAYFPQSEFQRIRHDAASAFAQNVRTAAPGLYERMLAGGQVDRLYGTGDQRNFFRTAAGPGWVLVGDAGHHRDSITARGITHAFLQAELLTDLLPADLADEQVVGKALTQFAIRRHDALIDDYHDTLSVGKLSCPPHRVDMLREVAGDPVRTARFFAGMAGTVRDEPAKPDMASLIRWMRESRRPVGSMS